jgi:hypothetical protein
LSKFSAVSFKEDETNKDVTCTVLLRNAYQISGKITKRRDHLGDISVVGKDNIKVNF